MLAAGTSNRNCSIFLAFLHEAGQEEIDHAPYMGKKRGIIRVGFDERTEFGGERGRGDAGQPFSGTGEVDDEAVDQRTDAPFGSEHQDLHGASYGGSKRFFL